MKNDKNLHTEGSWVLIRLRHVITGVSNPWFPLFCYQNPLKFYVGPTGKLWFYMLVYIWGNITATSVSPSQVTFTSSSIWSIRRWRKWPFWEFMWYSQNVIDQPSTIIAAIIPQTVPLKKHPTLVWLLWKQIHSNQTDVGCFFKDTVWGILAAIMVDGWSNIFWEYLMNSLQWQFYHLLVLQMLLKVKMS